MVEACVRVAMRGREKLAVPCPSAQGDLARAHEKAVVYAQKWPEDEAVQRGGRRC